VNAQVKDENKSFAIYDKPLDISRPTMVEPWRKLANQTHLRLLLLNENYEVEGFYEFENDFGFDEAVECISLLVASRVIDLAKAEEKYFNDYVLLDLYEMVKNS
jgi:hypothetical protein